jgi:hypothetical protein
MKEPRLKLKKDKLVAHDGKDTLRVWPGALDRASPNSMELASLGLGVGIFCELLDSILLLDAMLGLYFSGLALCRPQVWPPDESRGKLSFEMQRLKNALPNVVVCGIKKAARAVVVKKEKREKGIRGTWDVKLPRYCLLVEDRAASSWGRGGRPAPLHPPCAPLAVPRPDDSYPPPIASACNLVEVAYRRPPG